MLNKAVIASAILIGLTVGYAAIAQASTVVIISGGSIPISGDNGDGIPLDTGANGGGIIGDGGDTIVLNPGPGSSHVLGGKSLRHLAELLRNLGAGDGDAASALANFTSSSAVPKVLFASGGNVETDGLKAAAVAAVPLPAALPLFGAVLGGMGIFGRKRRKAMAA